LRLILRILPHLIAVPAFKKPHVGQPKSGYTKYKKQENTHGRDSLCNVPILTALPGE
jgi:hypothetical protein